MIIVTGASRGLGLAIADHLHLAGEEVLGISRTQVAAGYRTEELDITDEKGLRVLANELAASDVPVTGLINAAGIASMNLALMTPANKVRQILETNLTGTILVNQAFAKLLIKSAPASIVNFSTIAVRLALAGESIYAASKAGLETFTRTFARELAPHGVRANCVAPGPIDTDLIRGVPRDKIQKIIDQQVIKNQFTPADVIDVVDFLLSSKSKSISGQTLSIGG